MYFWYIQILIVLPLYFYLFFVLSAVLNPVRDLILKQLSNKPWNFLDRLRLCMRSSYFMNMGDMSHDIKVSATSSSGKTYSWLLRKENRIGNFKFKNGLSALTVLFYFDTYGSEFANPLFYNAARSWIEDRNEKMVSLQITKLYFNSYTGSTEKAASSEIVYDWNK